MDSSASVPPGDLSSAASGGTGAAPQKRYQYSSAPAKAKSTSGDVPIAPGSPALASAPLEWNKVTLGLLAAAVGFAILYLNDIFALSDRWYNDAGWSHGFVVPLISIYFIHLKWETLRTLKPAGSWVGMLLLLIGVAGEVTFHATGTSHMANLSMLVSLYGGVLFILGWNHLRLLWLPISFLVFAVPPPGPLYVAMTTPMQRLAAVAGVHLMPLFGVQGTTSGTTMLVSRGNVSLPLDVAQACSGMRMLVAFFALAVALAYTTSRPIWQKVFLAMCALPIAILCNAFRVAITGVLAVTWGEEWAKGSTHETVGLLMLIPALFLQLGMGWVLDQLFIEDSSDKKTTAPATGGAV